SSWKEPGSSSFSTRSRAVSLPFSCCFSTAFSEAEWIAASRSSWSWASFSSYVSGTFCRLIRAGESIAEATLGAFFTTYVKKSPSVGTSDAPGSSLHHASRSHCRRCGGGAAADDHGERVHADRASVVH